MSLRLVEVIVPKASQDAIQAAVEDQPTLDQWGTEIHEERVKLSYLMGSGATEAGIEALEARVDAISGARIVLIEVEATIPHPQDEAEEAKALAEQQPWAQDEIQEEAEKAEQAATSTRVSTPELYHDVLDMSELTGSYVGLVVLSTIVAAFGLINGSIIAIIGAMVIAPLIGPNVGLSLATTLADTKLAGKSIVSSTAGVAAALFVSFLFGLWLPVDPTVPELAGRTAINLLDIGLALAAGSAAVLSLTVGVSTALVGVMVAVALLPPLAAAGLLSGAGFTDLAFKAVLLATSNLICINLAGVVTFLYQGIRPTQHWEAEKAKEATISAVLIWTALLALLVYIVWIVVGVDFITPKVP